MHRQGSDAAIRRGPVILASDTRLIPFRHGVEVPPMYRYSFRKTGMARSISHWSIIPGERDMDDIPGAGNG